MSRNLQPGQVLLRNKCPQPIGLVDQHGTEITIDIGSNKTPIEIEVRPSKMSGQQIAATIRKQMSGWKESGVKTKTVIGRQVA